MTHPNSNPVPPGRCPDPSANHGAAAARAFLATQRLAPDFSGSVADAILGRHIACEAQSDGHGRTALSLEQLSDTLARSLTTDNPEGALQTLPYGVPTSALTELRARLSEAQDPWADCAEHGQAIQLRKPVARQLLAIFMAARAEAEGDLARRAIAPGQLSVLRCKDVQIHAEIAAALADRILPHALQNPNIPGAETETDPQTVPIADAPCLNDDLSLEDLLCKIDIHEQEALESGQTRFKVICVARAAPRDRLRDPVPAQITEALCQGEAVFVLCASRDDLDPEVQALVGLEMNLPRCDADMVLDMLRLTHARSGQVADAAIRSLLPSAEDLARLTPTQIEAAFRQPSTLTVAARLAGIAAASPTRARRTLADLHGLGPVVQGAFDGVVRDLALWRRGKLRWGEVTASFLLHGPPGCGKTMAAEALAGSADCVFMCSSYAELQAAGHMGDLLARLQTRVDEAARAAPCVLFFDELDSFGQRHRAGKNTAYMTAVVNGMLEALGRLARTEGVVVIGATNHPQAIDPALIRSGRFDRKIAILPPDRAGISAILRAELASDLGGETELAQIADGWLGASGADIAALARLARTRARGCARNGQGGQAISLADLEAAAAEILPHSDPDLLRRIVVHEAGHVVVGAALGLAPQTVRVGPQGGETVFPQVLAHTQASAAARLACLMAGRAAERQVFGEVTSGAGTGPTSDLAQATRLALQLDLQWGMGDAGRLWHPEPHGPTLQSLPPWLRAKLEGVLLKAENTAANLLQTHRIALHRLIEHLADARELVGPDLTAPLERWMSLPGPERGNIVEFRRPD